MATENLERKQTIVAVLQSIFTAMYATSYTAQIGHWHVRGADFNDIHGYFGAEYDVWSGKVDVVAEHLRTHGAFMPTSIAALGAKAPKDAGSVETSSAALVRTYAKHLTLLSTLIEKLNVVATEENSAADIDLAGELARDVKKALWKATSILARQSA